MKQYPWKFKLDRTGIEWWQSEMTLDSDHYFYYFRWGVMDMEMRNAYRKFKDGTYIRRVFGTNLFGIHKFWYDCPHAQLNLYYIVFYWSTPWRGLKCQKTTGNNKKEK